MEAPQGQGGGACFIIFATVPQVLRTVPDCHIVGDHYLYSKLIMIIFINTIIATVAIH